MEKMMIEITFLCVSLNNSKLHFFTSISKTVLDSEDLTDPRDPYQNPLRFYSDEL